MATIAVVSSSSVRPQKSAGLDQIGFRSGEPWPGMAAKLQNPMAWVMIPAPVDGLPVGSEFRLSLADGFDHHWIKLLKHGGTMVHAAVKLEIENQA